MLTLTEVGVWSCLDEYSRGDVVTCGFIRYVCLMSNTPGHPYDCSAVWLELETPDPGEVTTQALLDHIFVLNTQLAELRVRIEELEDEA